MIRMKNKITGSSPTGTKTHTRSIPHVLPTHVRPHHSPTTHRPSHYHSSTTTVGQYVPTNPQRQHSTTAINTTAVHLWYARRRSWVGFALSCDSPPSGGEREPSPTKHPPPTTNPPTNPPPQKYNSSGAVRTDQSTTAARSNTAVRTTAVHLWYARRRSWVGFALSCDSPPSGGEREPSPTKHPPPITHQLTNPPPQQYNSSGALRTDLSTTAAQYAPQRYTCGTPGAGWDLHFLRFSTLRRIARAVPGRGFSCPPLAELGLVGRCVAGDTESWCVGRAWHGRAVTRGRMASGRVESCKGTILKVGRIAPFARKRSHVILVRHIYP